MQKNISHNLVFVLTFLHRVAYLGKNKMLRLTHGCEMLVSRGGFCCAASVCSVCGLVGTPFFIAADVEMQVPIGHAHLYHVLAALLSALELTRTEFLVLCCAVVKERSFILLCGIA